MTHIKDAKDLVSRKSGQVIKVFLLTLLLELIILVFLFQKNPLFVILGLLGSVFVSLLATNALCEFVVKESKNSIFEVLKSTARLFKLNFLDFLLLYILLFVCVFGITIVWTISFTAMMLVSPIIGIIFYIVSLLAVCCAVAYVSYRIEYRIAGMVRGLTKERTKEIIREKKADCFEMGWKILLLSCVPIVGLVLAIIWGYYYSVKILLDVA